VFEGRRRGELNCRGGLFLVLVLKTELGVVVGAKRSPGGFWNRVGRSMHIDN